MPFNILSMDGGGIRGIFTARLVARLAEQSPGFLDKVRLVAGTSTGGILALAVARGLSPVELVNLYRKNGERIFKKRLIGGFWGAKYGNEGLKQVLMAALGADTKLKELRKWVMIPSWDLDRAARPTTPREGRPKFFVNNPDDLDADLEELAWEVALCTSAAPTYFPSYKGFIDGGVVANNPSACAVAEARSYGASDIRLVSVGTGMCPSFIEGLDNDWGTPRWAPQMIGLMIDGVNGVDDFQCRQDLRDGYFRLDAVLPRPVDLDDVSSVEDLVKMADAVDLERALTWLRRNWL